MIENKYCKCGQPINIEHNSKNTFRRDGLRFYVPEQKHPGACLFRCPVCSRVVKYDNLLELGLLEEKPNDTAQIIADTIASNGYLANYNDIGRVTKLIGDILKEIK